MALCCYCKKEADGPMLGMGTEVAHVECVIHNLNELLDYDYDGGGKPIKIIGYLAQERERIFRELEKDLIATHNGFGITISMTYIRWQALKGE